jgi:hypothetical protein
VGKEFKPDYFDGLLYDWKEGRRRGDEWQLHMSRSKRSGKEG